MDQDTRTSMKGAPCTRGLKAFKTCPGKVWNGHEGCPLWFEDLITVQEGLTKKEVMRGQCIDRWSYDFMWWNNARLAGNQQAIETFRNNMTSPDGRKPDPALVKLVRLMEQREKVMAYLLGSKAREITG